MSRRDFPAEKYSNAIVGFGPEESQFVIGLTDHRMLISSPQNFV